MKKESLEQKIIIPPLEKSVHKDFFFVQEKYYGLGKQSVFRVFCSLIKLHQYFSKQGLNPEIFMLTKKLEKFCVVSPVTLKQAKQVLVKKELIQIALERNYGHGSVCHIKITNSGLALYDKIQKEKEQDAKPKRKKKFQYEDEDIEIAKYWFKQLKKYWRGTRTGENIGSWESSFEIRADSIRRCRALLKCDGDFILGLLKFASKEDFYLQNVCSPDKLLRKWKNGKTVIENIQDSFDKRIKQQEMDAEKIISQKDVPMYDREDGGVEEDPEVSKVWNSMWKILGEKLKTKFPTREKSNEELESLYILCDELARRINFNAHRVTQNNSNINTLKMQDRQKKYSYYWYYVLDRYSNWNGIINASMLWSPWFDFWKKAWRLDHGINPTTTELEDFVVTGYADF